MSFLSTLKFPKLEMPTKEWFTKTPLTPKGRGRLEIAAGVALTAMAVTVLSTGVKPNPEKTAFKINVVELPDLTPEEIAQQQTGGNPKRMGMPDDRPYPTAEFYKAVANGDVAAMSRTYVRRQHMDGFLTSAANSGSKPAVVWLLNHGADVHENELGSRTPIIEADAHRDIVELLLSRGAQEPDLESAAAANAPFAFEAALKKKKGETSYISSAFVAAAGTTRGTAQNKLNMMTRLLAEGAQWNPSSRWAQSPLAAAVTACDEHIKEELPGGCMVFVRLILDRGANVTGEVLAATLGLGDDVRGPVFETIFPLPFDKQVTTHALANASNVDAADLKRLVKKTGVDWAYHDGEDDALLPVMSAVRRGNRDMLSAFLDAGAPVDVHYKEGTSPLSDAIDASISDNGAGARMVELLVARGANVNRRLADGRTPLFAAAEAGNLRVVNFLLSKGARVGDMVLDDTALDAAERSANQSCARVLAAHGAKRGVRNTW